MREPCKAERAIDTGFHAFFIQFLSKFGESIGQRLANEKNIFHNCFAVNMYYS